MPEKFHLFRLSLLANPQREINFSTPKFAEGLPREKYLRAIFAQKYKYQIRGREYAYEPDATLSDERDRKFMIGRVGRPFHSLENEAPEAGLRDKIHKGWKASLVALDPTDHFDGQKVAVEFDPTVGKPTSMIRYLVEHINRSEPGAPYIIFVEPITSERSFWDFVSSENNTIKIVQFDFISPNMVDVAGKLQSELDAYQKEENADEVSIKLSSRNGFIDVLTEKIKAAVARASRGKGRIRAKAASGRTYSSDSRIATSILPLNPETPMIDAKASIGRRALLAMDTVLNRHGEHEKIND